MKRIVDLTAKEFFYKLSSKIKKTYTKYSPDPRPSSYPYISSDSFRKIADYIYDETTKNFDPQKINYRDVVFVRYDFLIEYFTNIHPQISNQYILISHINDESVDERFLRYIDDKIIKWYAQNVTVNHPKLIPLPIGLQNLYNYNYGTTSIYKKLAHQQIDKKNKILFGFTIGKKELHYEEERTTALQSLLKNHHTFRIEKPMVQISYLSTLNEYKFVASPPGRGVDCHRTWEAMYLKTIPIVKKSILTDYFYNLGMPMWVIENWDELIKFSEEQLVEKYNSLKDRFNNGTIFMDYWIKKVRTE